MMPFSHGAACVLVSLCPWATRSPATLARVAVSRSRGQVIQAVEAEQRGTAGRLGKVAETVVPRGLEDGLERQAGAAAVAGQDVGPAGEAKGAEQGQAVQHVADVLRVDGLAGQVGVIVLDGVIGPIAVDCDVLTDGEAERKIVVLTAAPDTEDETKFRLAVVSGVYDTAHS